MTGADRTGGGPVSPWTWLLACGLLFGWPAHRLVAADRVVTAAATLLGEVISMTPDTLEFRVQGSTGRPQQITASEIVSLVLESEPPRVTEARRLVGQSEYQAALDVIAEVTPVELEVASAAARGEYAYVKALAAGRRAIATGTELAAAGAGVTDFLDRFSRTIHRYEMLELAGDLELAAGRPEAALARYRQLAVGPPSLTIRAARREAETLLKLGRAAEAASVFSAAAELPAPDPASRRERTATTIGAAECLIALDRPDEAVKRVRQLLALVEPPAAADEESQRQIARGYATLGRASLAAGREQDALIAYLTVDLVHSGDPLSHAEALFRLVELWNRGRYPQRAGEARRRLEASYPDSPWADLLDRTAD
jgi:tetratricopeptide (TPR) repeat protein